MKNKNILNMLVFLPLLVLFAAGCLQAAEESPVTEEIEEEAIDTGVLAIESSPSGAEVYVEGKLKGSTPLDLYNFPVGSYDVLIKKEGYMDFEKRITIRVGRTEEIDAGLEPIGQLAEHVEEEAEQALEEVAEDKPASKLEANTIELTKFLLYLDFDNIETTNLRTPQTDVFSKKYDNYVHFTAINNANIIVIDKKMGDVKEDDCTFASSVVGSLKSGQTLCIKTSEGSTVAVAWKTDPSKLEFISFG